MATADGSGGLEALLQAAQQRQLIEAFRFYGVDVEVVVGSERLALSYPHAVLLVQDLLRGAGQPERRRAVAPSTRVPQWPGPMVR